MFGERTGAARNEVPFTQRSGVCVMGKMPSRPDFVHYGLQEEPERVFRAWLEHAVSLAGGVLPHRAVRFIVAPRRTPMIGVWVPSEDGYGRAFPLVFLRRLPGSAAPPENHESGPSAARRERRASHVRERAHRWSARGDEARSGSVRRSQREPRDLGDLPWTLLLAACSHYLGAAESGLMMGRSRSIAELWGYLGELELPAASDVAELWAEACGELGRESLRSFAKRNLGEQATGETLATSVRRLGARPALAGDAANTCTELAALSLPADGEFDLFAWLELLRAQRRPGMTPRALFWSPADKRALIGLGAPLPGTLAFLRQPRAETVQRLPLEPDPDEYPALEHELKVVIAQCETLAQLMAAIARDGVVESPAKPEPTNVTPQPEHARPKPQPASTEHQPATVRAQPRTANANAAKTPGPDRAPGGATPEPTRSDAEPVRANLARPRSPVSPAADREPALSTAARTHTDSGPGQSNSARTCSADSRSVQSVAAAELPRAREHHSAPQFHSPPAQPVATHARPSRSASAFDSTPVSPAPGRGLLESHECEFEPGLTNSRHPDSLQSPGAPAPTPDRPCVPPGSWLDTDRLPVDAEAFMPPPLRSRASC
jgi:type VI secretion system ImpM family protein